MLTGNASGPVPALWTGLTSMPSMSSPCRFSVPVPTFAFRFEFSYTRAPDMAGSGGVGGTDFFVAIYF